LDLIVDFAATQILRRYWRQVELRDTEVIDRFKKLSGAFSDLNYGRAFQSLF